ncbi:fructokinase [Actinopolyspora alba]|uniref:Fructokinase n=1 Tax=Actinopolyspora alba TaxID=673379 RepID=A0A1I1X3R2_9ACTN|nr:fructokinase [Actinopolyspora alba]
MGESLVDIVHERDGSVIGYPGGSAANVAVALARLGRPTWFATSYTDDDHGRLIADHLGRDQVRLATDVAAIDHTSAAVATIAADGAARYRFDIDWRLNPLALPDSVQPVALHACSLGAVLMPGCEQVYELVDRLRVGALVSYDLNARPAVTGSGPEVLARLQRLVAISDVVKASEEDLDVLYPDLDHLAAARDLLAHGPRAVVVTKSHEGALVLTHSGTVHAPAPMGVVVADTIGAGDTVGAALLDALWAKDVVGHDARTRLDALTPDTWREILTYAGRAASVTVSRPGANPPYRGELIAG